MVDEVLGRCAQPSFDERGRKNRVHESPRLGGRCVETDPQGEGCVVIIDEIKYGQCEPGGGRYVPASVVGRWLLVVTLWRCWLPESTSGTRRATRRC